MATNNKSTGTDICRDTKFERTEHLGIVTCTKYGVPLNTLRTYWYLILFSISICFGFNICVYNLLLNQVFGYNAALLMRQAPEHRLTFEIHSRRSKPALSENARIWQSREKVNNFRRRLQLLKNV